MRSDQLSVMWGPFDGTNLRTTIDLVHAHPRFGVPKAKGSIGRTPPASDEVRLPRAPIHGFDGGGVFRERVGWEGVGAGIADFD